MIECDSCGKSFPDYRVKSMDTIHGDGNFCDYCTYTDKIPKGETVEEWSNDTLQFARLLSYINFGDVDFKKLKIATGLNEDNLNELLDRADFIWNDGKTKEKS